MHRLFKDEYKATSCRYWAPKNTEEGQQDHRKPVPDKEGKDIARNGETVRRK